MDTAGGSPHIKVKDTFECVEITGLYSAEVPYLYRSLTELAKKIEMALQRTWSSSS